MQVDFIRTENYQAGRNLVQALMEPLDPRLPRMGMLWGQYGLGKTTVAEKLRDESGHAYAPAHALWTPAWMLRDIAEDLGVRGLSGNCRTETAFNAVVEALRKKPRLLIVDDAHFCLREGGRCLLTLRNLHDRTWTPILLVGEERLHDGMKRYGAVWSCIAGKEVAFQPLNRTDIALIAQSWYGLDLEPPASDLLAQRTLGDFRLAASYLAELARGGKVTGRSQITRSDVLSVLEGAR